MPRGEHSLKVSPREDDPKQEDSARKVDTRKTERPGKMMEVSPLPKVIIDLDSSERRAELKRRISESLSKTEASQRELAQAKRNEIINNPDLDLPSKTKSSSLDDGQMGVHVEPQDKVLFNLSNNEIINTPSFELPSKTESSFLDDGQMGAHVESQNKVLFDASQFENRNKFGESKVEGATQAEKAADTQVPVLRAPSGRSGEKQVSHTSIGATDVSSVSGHDRHRFAHPDKSVGLSNEAEAGDSSAVATEKVINRLKEEWGVSVNPDGSASGFFNKRKFRKLEETNPSFIKLLNDLKKINSGESMEIPVPTPEMSADTQVPVLRAPSGRSGEKQVSHTSIGVTDVSSVSGHDRHRFANRDKSVGLSNEVSKSDSPAVGIEKIIKQIKDVWGVVVNPDGTASGFFNKRKVTKLERNDSEFSSL